jgi:hypothetical protein
MCIVRQEFVPGKLAKQSWQANKVEEHHSCGRPSMSVFAFYIRPMAQENCVGQASPVVFRFLGLSRFHE